MMKITWKWSKGTSRPRHRDNNTGLVSDADSVHLGISSCHFLLELLAVQLLLGLLVQVPQHDGILVAQCTQFRLLLLQLRQYLVVLISTARSSTLLLVIVGVEDS